MKRTILPRLTRREANGCLIWIGHTNKQGYGKTHGQMAHRIAYEMAYGPIPPGLEIDHLCRTRACVEPTHLEAVSHRENIMRSDNVTAVNARKTHCVNGHEYTPENTYNPPGVAVSRACRSCNLAAVLRYKERRAA